MTNADPNTYVKTFACSVCLLNWQYTWTAKEEAALTRLPDGAHEFPPQVI
jgi:hypothetical protein